MSRRCISHFTHASGIVPASNFSQRLNGLLTIYATYLPRRLNCGAYGGAILVRRSSDADASIDRTVCRHRQGPPRRLSPASDRPPGCRDADSGKVRIGGLSPSLPARTTRQRQGPPRRPEPEPSESRATDSGKVRLGGQSPSLPVAHDRQRQGPPRRPEPEPSGRATTDSGKVRLGGQSPSLPGRARSRTTARSAWAARARACRASN